jgi:hypothetical protein
MKKILSSLILLLLFVKVGMAQAQYQPYYYQFYQKFNEDLYSTKTRIHTSLKPFIIDSPLQRRYDSLMNYGSDNAKHTWAHRKLFNEHLIDVKSKDFNVYADYLPDLVIGKDYTAKKTPG